VPATQSGTVRLQRLEYRQIGGNSATFCEGADEGGGNEDGLFEGEFVTGIAVGTLEGFIDGDGVDGFVVVGLIV